MSEDKTYNGWSNYETWVVALWLDNEQGSYNYWNERAQEIYDDAEGRYEWETKEDCAANLLADELKERHEQDAPETTGVYADLINAALSEVDWREIAEHYLNEVDKEVEEVATEE